MPQARGSFRTRLASCSEDVRALGRMLLGRHRVGRVAFSRVPQVLRAFWWNFPVAVPPAGAFSGSGEHADEVAPGHRVVGDRRFSGVQG